jgi:CheY-like chemotaxis protein
MDDYKQGRPARALVIEDEPVIAADIRHMLMEAGYPVVAIAATKAESIAAFERYQPDFILADIQLVDGSSGIDAVEAIRKIRNVPVIFLTAFPERLLAASRSEPVYLIAKPFGPETLIAAVDKLLQKNDRVRVPSDEARLLSAAVSEALLALARVEPSEAEAFDEAAGLGHNRPPSNDALSEEDYRAVTETLQNLLSVGAKGVMEPGQFEDAKNVLVDASDKISSWMAAKFAQIEDGFFKQIGSSLADWKLIAAAWLVVSGKLDALVAALVAFHRAGGG